MAKIISEDSFHSPSLAAFVLYVTYTWTLVLLVVCTNQTAANITLLLMFMLDHCFCASFQQHHSSGRPRRRGLESGLSMRTVTDLARKWEMNLINCVQLVWSKTLLWISCAVFACLFKSRCRSSLLLFPFAVISVLDPDGHELCECSNFCV